MTLALTNLEFAYRPGRPVVRDLSLSFEPGTLTALVGPNGCGKSTLLRLMLGVLTPTAGGVTLAGGVPPRLERARRVAYVPQQGEVAFAFTLRQVVALGAYARGGREDEPAVEEALGRVGLAHRAGDLFGELSAGQRQLGVLARALVQLQSPAPGVRVLLADEPTAAMDPRHAVLTLGLLAALASSGAVVVAVLHDLSAVLRFASRAVVLEEGARVAADAPPRGAITPDVLGRVFGVPFTPAIAGGGGEVVGMIPGAGAAVP